MYSSCTGGTRGGGSVSPDGDNGRDEMQCVACVGLNRPGLETDT